jgi:hypothetical protein
LGAGTPRYKNCAALSLQFLPPEERKSKLDLAGGSLLVKILAAVGKPASLRASKVPFMNVLIAGSGARDKLLSLGITRYQELVSIT